MSLTDEQNNAINSSFDNNLLLAGPGTGKSFTILNYIRFLIDEKNIQPDKILVLTFTRAATHELTPCLSQTTG